MHAQVVAMVLDGARNSASKGLTAVHLAVQQGCDSLVADLLRLPGLAPDTRDADGLSALHWAASKGAPVGLYMDMAVGVSPDSAALPALTDCAHLIGLGGSREGTVGWTCSRLWLGWPANGLTAPSMPMQRQKRQHMLSVVA